MTIEPGKLHEPIFRSVHIPHILVDCNGVVAGMGNPIVRLNGVNNDHAVSMARAWDGANQNGQPHRWVPLAVDGQCDMFEDIPVPAPRFEPMHKLSDAQIDHVIETTVDDNRQKATPKERALIRAAIEFSRNLALSLPQPVKAEAETPPVQTYFGFDERGTFLADIATWRDAEPEFEKGRSNAEMMIVSTVSLATTTAAMRSQILYKLGQLFQLERMQLEDMTRNKGY